MKTITTIEEYNGITENKFIVKVGTACCGACTVMRNTLESIEDKHPDWGFYDIDADECDPEIIDMLEVDSIPTTMIFPNKSDAPKSIIVGIVSADKIEAML